MGEVAFPQRNMKVFSEKERRSLSQQKRRKIIFLIAPRTHFLDLLYRRKTYYLLDALSQDKRLLLDCAMSFPRHRK